jgi:hypothetical protein
MQTPNSTEAEMRDSDAAHPKTIGELSDYIEALVKREHDYGTCVYAMSMAATAAFNYVAGQLGVTGFQASCADMDILRRTRSLKGPFMLIDAEKMLYPQYDLREQLAEALTEWQGWAGDEAKKKLAEGNGRAHPDVLAHWRALAANATGAQQ